MEDIRKQILNVSRTNDACMLPWQLCKKTLLPYLASHQRKFPFQTNNSMKKHIQSLSF